jgi:nucleoid-associated protein YgaU
MKKWTVDSGQWTVYGLLTMLFLSGCTVRTYSAVKDRVDQEAGGNQGYLSGSAPAGAQAPKKFTQRATRVIEIEMRSPVKFEKLKEPPKPIEQPETRDSSLEGNRGYLEGQSGEFNPAQAGSTQGTAAEYDTYIVKKDDTLQKISAQFYGTTKKWAKLFEVNKDKLKGPDKLRAGQELKIPRE